MAVALATGFATTAFGEAADAAATANIPQIRGGHLGSAIGDPGVLPKMRAVGMNSIFVPIKSQVAEERIATLDRWQKLTSEQGLDLFPLVSIYRPGDRAAWPLQRRFTDISGKVHVTPCPNDPEFWQKKITDAYVEIARWAKDHPNVPGIFLDAEMYGADQSVYQDACFCNDCRREVAKRLGVEPKDLDLNHPSALERYRTASTELVRQSTVGTRRQAHEVYPECILGGYVLDHDSPFYRGLLLAWGTPEQPVLIMSERPYEVGYTDDFESWKRRVADWGVNAHWVPGVWLNRIPAENIAEHLYHLARNDRGYFLYDMVALSEDAPALHVLPGEGPPAYWAAIEQANQELDRWVKSDGEHTSSLKVRPFELPAPGLALEAWKRLELPQDTGRSPEAPFMQRQSQGLFFMPASAGDEVRVQIRVDALNPRKIDSVTLVILDPAGEVVWDAAMSKSGQKVAQFRARETGTYCLIAKSVRYAFQIGESTHNWVADAPLGATVALFKPSELFVQPLPGVERIRLGVSVPGPGEGVIVTVRGGDGVVLAQQAVQELGRTDIDVPLASAGSRPLQIGFSDAPGGTVEDVGLSLLEGVRPFVAASPDAPFPRE